VRPRVKTIVSVVFALVLALTFVTAAENEAKAPPDGIYFVRPDSSERETIDFRPEYVSEEVLVFYSCIEGAPRVFNSVYCKDDVTNIIELPVYPWENGCFISSYDLNASSCTELVVMTEYEHDDEILNWDEEIVIKDIDSIPYVILDAQASDGGWGDPISTAWVIWALSEFNRESGGYENNTYTEQIEGGLRWLKENRDPQEKCWSADEEDECSIEITAEVLAMLNEANLTRRADWLRIVHDGSLWLSLQQNLFDIRDPTVGDVTTETWKALITGQNWTDGSINIDYSSCLIQYTDELDMTLQVVFDQTYQINFTPIHDEFLNIICTPNSLPLSIRNSKNKVIFNSTTGNVSYHIPGACWDDKEPWNFCDVKTTGYATTVALDEIRSDLATDWMKNTLIQSDIGEYFNTSDKYYDTAWMLYKRFARDGSSSNADDDIELSDQESKILRWLLYNQNNDGSWGNTSLTFAENLPATAMASVALSKVNNGSLTEFIKDANIWISQNRPLDGWDTVQSDALGFLAFSRSAKPFIWSQDGMIIVTKNQQDIELYNPSSFDFDNLEFVLDDHLKQYIEIEEIGSLASDYFKDIRIILTTNPEQSLFGYLSILNEGYEVGKFPVVIQTIPDLEFSLAKSLIPVYNGKGTLEFNILKGENVALDCSLTWDDPTITSKNRFKIDKQKSIATDIVLSEIQTQKKTYEGQFDCLFNGLNMTFPLSVNTIQFDDIPFSVAPDSINLTSFDDTLSFTIYNNVDVEITVTSTFATEDPYVLINEPQVIIPPLESREVSLTHYLIENESTLWDNTIKVEGYDRVEYVNLVLDYEARRSLSSFMGLLFTFAIVFGILGGGGFLLYSRKDQVIAMLPDEIRKKLPAALTASAAGATAGPGGAPVDDKNAHHMEKKVEAKNFVHVAEIIKIMKGLGQDDDEISKRLQGEGYNRGEINELFTRVQEEMDAETTLEKEDKFMKLMKDLDADVGAVRTKLKQDGFTDTEIKEAFKQAEEEILTKRTDLDKKIKDMDKYNISEEDAAKADKGNAEGGAAGAEGGEKKEEKKE
jgi:hypothetical protein